MIARVSILVALATMAGCTTVPVTTAARPDSYYSDVATDESAASLFSGDEAVLSDADIERILAFDYSPPALSRIALMPFGREVWSTWSEELSAASEQTRKDVVGELMSSAKVYDASYLPSILIPDKKTVPYLREAAARYQADLLMVYRSYCRSFERYRLFSADQSRAYCGVEAVLIDTRPGLVPFTSSTSSTFDLTEDASDISFRETILKAQQEAITRALADVSKEVAAFLAR